jgi:hypothetical protein
LGVERLEAVEPAQEALARDELLVPLRSLLVDRGLTPNEVTVEQRRSSMTSIPNLSVAAVHIEDVPAELIAALNPETFARLTLRPDEVALMPEEKPAPSVASIGDRPVNVTTWGSTRLAWFAHGAVLYIVLADNEELLSRAIRNLPALPAPAVVTDCLPAA